MLRAPTLVVPSMAMTPLQLQSQPFMFGGRQQQQPQQQPERQQQTLLTAKLERVDDELEEEVFEEAPAVTMPMSLKRTASESVDAVHDDEPPRTVPAFLAKLYTMINDPATDHLIHWSRTRESHFVIPCHKAFAKHLLPLNFRHNNFTSFVRQLNMYGFRKVADMEVMSNAEDSSQRPWEFEHKYLVRGQPQLLVYIQRKSRQMMLPPPPPLPASAQVTAEAAAGSGLSSSSSSSAQTIKALEEKLSEQVRVNDDLKRQLQQSEESVTSMAQRLATVENENKVLWREYIQATKKFRQQEETTNRIMSFLNNIYSGGGHSDNPKNDTLESQQKSSSLADLFAGGAPFITAKRNPAGSMTAPLFETDFVLQPATSAMFAGTDLFSGLDTTTTSSSSQAAAKTTVPTDQTGLSIKPTMSDLSTLLSDPLAFIVNSVGHKLLGEDTPLKPLTKAVPEEEEEEERKKDAFSIMADPIFVPENSATSLSPSNWLFM